MGLSDLVSMLWKGLQVRRWEGTSQRETKPNLQAGAQGCARGWHVGSTPWRLSSSSSA